MPEVSAPVGPPLLGALLRLPAETIRGHMLENLHAHGFSDITPAHMVILRYPGPDGRRPREVVEMSGSTKQAVHYLLEQLQRYGYIERSTDPDDGRSKILHLTPRGREVSTVMRDAVNEIEREWCAVIGEHDFVELKAILTRLDAFLRSGR